MLRRDGGLSLFRRVRTLRDDRVFGAVSTGGCLVVFNSPAVPDQAAALHRSEQGGPAARAQSGVRPDPLTGGSPARPPDFPLATSLLDKSGNEFATLVWQVAAVRARA